MAKQRYKSQNNIVDQADRLIKMARGNSARVARIKEISSRYQDNILSSDRVKNRVEKAILNGAGQKRMMKIEEQMANWKFKPSEYMGNAPVRNVSTIKPMKLNGTGAKEGKSKKGSGVSQKENSARGGSQSLKRMSV